MRRGAFGVVVALVVVVLGALGGRHVPEALAHVDAFRVRRVEVEGVRWLDPLEVRRHAAIPDSANVWNDLDSWARTLETHPMVRRASVKRRLPGTIVVTIEEREPLALAATPTLEPVDRDGMILPIDPAAVRLDLPVLRPEGEGLRALAVATERLRHALIGLDTRP